jgi:hypothetical protein
MIKPKYTFKDFVQLYLDGSNYYILEQEREYYELLSHCLSSYFEISLTKPDFNDEVSEEYETYEIIDKLMIEYCSIRNILKDFPLAVAGITKDLNVKFGLSYSSSSERRKKLLFDMIYFLYQNLLGSTAKTVTHQKLLENNVELFMFENKASAILSKIYTSRELKNEDNWSVFYDKEGLAEIGYSSVLPKDVGQVIKMGKYQIKAIFVGGSVAYCVKPL